MASKGKILHVPSTCQRATAHLKARKKLNFMIMVADFQIVNQEQKTFLKEIKKKFLLRHSSTNFYTAENTRSKSPNSSAQFASPKYVQMWKYSWFKAGYLDEHPQEFLNPVDYCFGKRSGLEKCSSCEQAEFITCSFCGETSLFYSLLGRRR